MRRPLDDESESSPADDVAVDHLLRPERATGLSEHARAWVEWFGLACLATSAVAVVVVCAGAWFLVRTPPPPSESSLPVTSAGSTPEATLPVVTAETLPPTTVASRAIVHVAGAVLRPGVYELGPGSRVDDAVQRAGGATADAELGWINLAAPVVDGDQIYVPVIGEQRPLPSPAGSTASASEAAPAGPVDVNRASPSELDSLPGIGPATAAAIVDERERNGPFSSFEDLERVPGIGPAKLAGLVGMVVT